MTDSERAALRALAEDAPVQKMSVEVLKDHDGPPECDQIMVVGPSPNDPTWRVNVLEVEWSYLRRSGSLNRAEGEAMASFIAATNPADVLAILDDIDALQSRLAECERDAQILRAATGELVKGFEHVSGIARQWEPDYSSGADRAKWARGTEACHDAKKLIDAAIDSAMTASGTGSAA